MKCPRLPSRKRYKPEEQKGKNRMLGIDTSENAATLFYFN